MKACKDFQGKFTAYLENAIGDAEAVEMWDHLESCPDCRMAFKEEQAFVSLLHDHLKTPPAPPHLALKIRSLLGTERTRRKSLTRFLPRFFPWPAAAFASLLLLIGWMFYTSRPTDLGWAVDAHRAVVERKAALDIETADAVELSRWFSGEIDPAVVPIDKSVSGLQLRGGRVIRRAEGRVVQVAFESDQGESSLFILPAGPIRLRGPAIDFGGLRFHPVKKEGYRLLAWSAPSVRYVLISRTAEGTDRGCLLCHGGGIIELPLNKYYQLRSQLSHL